MQKQPYKIYNPIYIVVTVFFVGKIPFAPGTWGSLAAVFDFLSTLVFSNGDIAFTKYYLMILGIFIISVPCIFYYIKQTGSKDPSEVVIDEYVGQYLTQILSLQIILQFNPDLPILYMLILVFTSFIFFRFFDIAKPLWIGQIDQGMKGSAMGVMLDDVAAAIFAVIANLIFYAVLLRFLIF